MDDKDEGGAATFDMTSQVEAHLLQSVPAGRVDMTCILGWELSPCQHLMQPGAAH